MAKLKEMEDSSSDDEKSEENNQNNDAQIHAIEKRIYELEH